MSLSSDTTAAAEDQLARLVDREWYLSAYPDVSVAAIDPIDHYCRFGRFEGRAPRPTKMIELDVALWSQDSGPAREQLERLAGDSQTPEDERCLAAWALARWYACVGDWKGVLRALDTLHQQPLGPVLLPHLGPALLRMDALRHTGARENARTLLEQEIRSRGPVPDLLLAGATIAGEDPVGWLNCIYRNAGLLPISSRDPSGALSMDQLTSATGWQRIRRALLCWIKTRPPQPLVSVLVPAHNAAATLATALHGLYDQTWKALDVVVIDDASGDDTLNIAADFARRDRRFKVVRHEKNQGAYASRNTGLRKCTGSLITVHDADDWSHPQKLELQALALLRDKSIQGSISHWARTTTDLEPAPERMETGYVHRNLSSLMFRRSVFERLGYWDRVAVGGDSEYAHRITRVYGPDAIRDVLPGIPLSLGRVQAGSLTRVDATHWRTFYGGVRRAYFDAAVAWHERTDDRELYLDERPAVRPFEAPEAIRR